MPNIYDLEALNIVNEPVALSRYRGQVLLIVNTATRCGFTPQLSALEKLWQRYRDAGLVILGFPCNQFGGQDPGSNEEIAGYCQLHHGVTFPMMAKIDVNGPQAHPVFRHLTQAAPGILGTQAIKWNFTKFLLGRDGQVLGRYGPAVSPHDLAPYIETALAAT